MNTRKTSKGFTLVELLIVIAIIGVLASLIMPNLGSVMGKGDQVKAQNAARSISNAWIAAARTGTKSRMIAAKDIYGWAEKLARYGDMNEPTMWILDFDVAVAEKAAEGAPMPISVINRVGTSSQLNPEFKEYPLLGKSPTAPSPTLLPELRSYGRAASNPMALGTQPTACLRTKAALWLLPTATSAGMPPCAMKNLARGS